MFFSSPSFTSDSHGWAELLPDRKPKPALTQDLSTHWTVVGAGLTGLAAARRLARLHPDETIVLLEARKLAGGASGRNSGYAVACSHFSGAYDADRKADYQRVNRINSAGLEELRKLVKAHAIDCQWHEQGFFHAAADQTSLREVEHFVDYLQQLDIAHNCLDREQLMARLGTGWYQRAVHVPQGALLQPAALVYGLADALPDNVRLFENSPVVALRSTPSGYQLSLANRIKLSTAKLLLATNYEAARLGVMQHRIVGSTLSGSFTRCLTKAELATLGDLKQWGVLSLHRGGATLRLTQDGRLCIRNTAEYHGGKLLSQQAIRKRQVLHRQSFLQRFPQLENVAFEYAWSGVEGITRNATSAFTTPAKNLYVAGAYNGSGVSRGTAFGCALAELASGGQSVLISDCLNSVAPSRLPPRPLLDIGAWFTVRKRFIGVGRDR